MSQHDALLKAEMLAQLANLFSSPTWFLQAANELRSLHTENAALKSELEQQKIKRIEAQTENEALKYKVAKSEVVKRRAVFEAVAKEREECAQTAMLTATNGIETSAAIRDREAHYVATT